MTIDITVGKSKPEICIGRRGENNATEVRFDITSMIETYGDGTVTLYVKRKGDAEAYPATVERDGEIVTWTVSNADTAYVGYGAAELWYYVDNVLAKTVVYLTIVKEDIGEETGTPPDPYETWLDQMSQYSQNAENAAAQAGGYADDAQTAAEEAEEAVTHYPKIVEGTWYVWNAHTGQWENTGISAGVTVEFQGTALVINT